MDAQRDEAEVALERLLAVAGAAFEQRGNLERALTNRVEIEQAKGMLAERLRLTLDEAFELIRRCSRDTRQPVHQLARRILDEPETPAPLLVTLQQSLSPRRRRG